MTAQMAKDKQLDLMMNISLVTGFFMLAIKSYATVITGSAAILSDAAESVVHVVAVTFAAWSLRLARKRSDKSHQFGYDRITFFSAGFEGAMIILAAGYIIMEAVKKIIAGPTIQELGLGTAISALVVVINGALGLSLIFFGKKNSSLIVEANGRHVLTDSVTSLGVLIGLLLCMFAQNPWFSSLYFDPIFAILAALNILKEGLSLVNRSFRGLMDTVPEAEETKIETLLAKLCQTHGVSMHELRTRNSGSRYWFQFHLIFDDRVLLVEAHDIATKIEGELVAVFPDAVVTTHLETQSHHDEAHRLIPESHEIKS
ncbi:MAG: cation diffusion facilitator family transporter [Spirochaetales bacterium]